MAQAASGWADARALRANGSFPVQVGKSAKSHNAADDGAHAGRSSESARDALRVRYRRPRVSLLCLIGQQPALSKTQLR